MPEQNLPAAAVSRQPCDRTRVIHALNCRSSRLNDEPNPAGGDFCPGFGICDCYVSEIERLQLALRIAVEEIQAGPHADDCDENFCVHCGRHHDAHDRTRLDPNPKKNFKSKPCNCRISSALARIERAKDGRAE